VGRRLDVFLAEKAAPLTRSQIRKHIDSGEALVNELKQRPGYRMREGDRVEFVLPVFRPQRLEAENIALQVVHQDEDVVVLEKPSGMVVHPGAGRAQHTLVHALLFHFPEIRDIGPAERPGIVHRLDKETSGLLVVARSPRAYESLREQFNSRQVEKEYTGLVWGRIAKAEGRIHWALGRHARNRERMSIRSRKSRPAETLYRVRQRYADFTLLDIRPITGRTHQIRVHLAASGHPLVGDTRYGRRQGRVRCPRLFLHARHLAFFHPLTGHRVVYSSPLPEDLAVFLEGLRCG